MSLPAALPPLEPSIIPPFLWGLALLMLLGTATLGFSAGYWLASTARTRGILRARRDVQRLYRATIDSLRTARQHCAWLTESAQFCLAPEQVSGLEQERAALEETLLGLVRRQQALAEVLEAALQAPRGARPAELAWLRQPADPETGLPDASALARNLQQMLAAGRSGSRAGGVLLIRMDKADQLRCRYGADGVAHLFRQLAAVVCRNLREKDLACRHTAEVLAVLHAGPDPQAGLRAAAALRQAVRQAVYRLGDGGAEVLVTASFGYAPCLPEDESENVLGRATSALERSQRVGRNQLHVYDSDGATYCPAGAVL